MASLRLHAVMVTRDEVEDLAQSARVLGHEVVIAPPPWEGKGGSRGRDSVVEWDGTHLRVAETERIVHLTQGWSLQHWTDRWRPGRLGGINAGGKWQSIPFPNEAIG
jgi:hypothetical protein